MTIPHATNDTKPGTFIVVVVGQSGSCEIKSAYYASYAFDIDTYVAFEPSFAGTTGSEFRKVAYEASSPSEESFPL